MQLIRVFSTEPPPPPVWDFVLWTGPLSKFSPPLPSVFRLTYLPPLINCPYPLTLCVRDDRCSCSSIYFRLSIRFTVWNGFALRQRFSISVSKVQDALVFHLFVYIHRSVPRDEGGGSTTSRSLASSIFVRRCRWPRTEYNSVRRLTCTCWSSVVYPCPPRHCVE